MTRIFGVALALGAWALLPANAGATQITQTFTFPDITGVPNNSQSPTENDTGNKLINLFDTSLGTLNFWTVVGSIDNLSPTDPIDVTLTLGGSETCGINLGPSTTDTLNGGNSSPDCTHSLTNLEATGTFIPTVNLFNAGDDDGAAASFGTFTLTYDFNPVGAVPEPSPLALLVAGLLGLGLLGRRTGRRVL